MPQKPVFRCYLEVHESVFVHSRLPKNLSFLILRRFRIFGTQCGILKKGYTPIYVYEYKVQCKVHNKEYYFCIGLSIREAKFRCTVGRFPPFKSYLLVGAKFDVIFRDNKILID